VGGGQANETYIALVDNLVEGEQDVAGTFADIRSARKRAYADAEGTFEPGACEGGTEPCIEGHHSRIAVDV
jgi:hypothetical protein